MATIYLHIGAPKTATSTLQNVLASNYGRLLKEGVLYPRNLRSADAHHELACDLIEKYQGSPMSDVWYGAQPRGQAWQSLQDEMEHQKNSIQSVIISTELFFGQSKNLEPIVEEMSNYLRGHEVKVIVYLRRQDQLYSSFYNQDVKGMRQWPDSAYQFYETHQLLECGYHSLLGMWSQAFGKKHIIIRPFEPEQWLNGDIVQDFCGSIGIEPLSSKYEDHNESLGITQLYVKRCLNRIGYEKNLNDEVLRVLAKICPEEPAKGCLYVHKGLFRKYRKEWLQINEALSADYLQDRPLFNGSIPKPEELDLYKINHLKLAGYIKNMVNIFGKGKYREYRALFAKATLLILAEQDMWYVLDAESRVELLKWV
jgi:hypothetical protein